MKKVSTLSPLFLALAAATGMASVQADDSSSSDGFIDGSHLNLDLKNYYLNRDGKNGYRDQTEWAQGFIGKFESGYTQGTVGFGLDVNAMMGLKLDGGGGTNGTGLLPEGSDDKGNAPTTYSSAGATLKVKAFDTVLRVGDLFLDNPVVAGGTTRLLPMTFQGFSLTNNSVKDLTLEAGQASFMKLYNQSGNQRLLTYYGTMPDGDHSKHISWAGASWKPVNGLVTKLYASQLKDVWNQVYANVDYTYALNDMISLNPGINYYRTQSSGQALLGSIDNNTYSIHFVVGVGNATYGLSMQKVNGDTPFDYIDDGDSIDLDNSQQWSDFNGPGEQSWKAAYGYVFSNFGLPGLSTNISYTRGKLDMTKASQENSGYALYYNPDGKNASHWERDIDLKYVVQSGPVKDMSVRLRWATNRGEDNYTADRNLDEYRFIVDYPINIF